MSKPNTSISNTYDRLSFGHCVGPTPTLPASLWSRIPQAPLRNIFALASCTAGTALILSLPNQSRAQEPPRWYQVEISIFTNENVNLTEERWSSEHISAGFPRNVRHLDSLLNVLNLDDWTLINPPLPHTSALPVMADGVTNGQIIPARSEGPQQFHNSNFRLPDFERDAFVELPASTHNFTDTNSALNASANYRLLYHSAWRQPVTPSAQATPIAIQAGRQFGDRHELEGSLTIGFNPSQDRVVLDTLMWLTQFSTVPPVVEISLQLPALPDALRPAALDDETVDSFASLTIPSTFYPVQIIPVRNSRDMRSNEFHYVDHPALGIVIQVFPYTPPPPMTPPEDQIL